MKKALIIGPISNFGGREIEANILLKSLLNEFNVSVLSTSFMTESSSAIQNVPGAKWNSLDKILFDTKLSIRLLCYLSKLYHKGNEKPYAYVNNFLTKKLFKIDDLHSAILVKQLKGVDFVVLCVQLTSKYLSHIVNYCNKNNIKCIVRTTGTIRQFDVNNYGFLKNIDLFIHHSENNAQNLNCQMQLPYVVIDQCALTEETLISRPIAIKKPLKFGYLGRLSPEKGILKLVNFFVNRQDLLIIAGDGDQKKEILEITDNLENVVYLGPIQANELGAFFDKIDVLIIPSREESGPLVGLEAMAAGKIIISTKVGAMADRLEGVDKSFWFNFEDFNSLNVVMNEVKNYSETELNLMAALLREKYKASYSFGSISEQYIKVIKQLLC